MHDDNAGPDPSAQPDAAPSSQAPQPDAPAAPPALPPDAIPTPVASFKGSVDRPADTVVLLERTGDAPQPSSGGSESASE